jgi:hypothetical protein
LLTELKRTEHHVVMVMSVVVVSESKVVFRIVVYRIRIEKERWK